VHALVAAQPALSQLGIRVVLVSFNSLEHALQWNQEVKVPLLHIVDPAKQLYQALNIPRSLIGVWNWEVLSFYSNQILQGVCVFQQLREQLMSCTLDVMVDHSPYRFQVLR